MTRKVPDPSESFPNPVTPEDHADRNRREPVHESSPTAEAAEALRTGVFPEASRPDPIPGEDVMKEGDPDADLFDNEYSGDDLGTPDQNDVDDIGRAAGIVEADNDDLHLGDELIAPRDRDRWELNPGSKDKPPRR